MKILICGFLTAVCFSPLSLYAMKDMCQLLNLSPCTEEEKRTRVGSVLRWGLKSAGLLDVDLAGIGDANEANTTKKVIRQFFNGKADPGIAKQFQERYSATGRVAGELLDRIYKLTKKIDDKKLDESKTVTIDNDDQSEFINLHSTVQRLLNFNQDRALLADALGILLINNINELRKNFVTQTEVNWPHSQENNVLGQRYNQSDE